MDKKVENKIEEALTEQLHNSYLRGLAVGGKAFVGTIYDIILKDKKQKINSAKTLIKIENSCKKMLDISDKYDKKTLAKNIIEAVDREKSKYEEKE